MHIRFLGVHNCASASNRPVSLLIDDVLALDAGALASSLSFEAQQKVKAILLTHQHYDHIRDVPLIAMNLFLRRQAIDVYSISPALDRLGQHLLNDELYPDFRQRPASSPSVRFNIIEPGKPWPIEGYSVLAVPVNHGVPAVGYQVTAADGRVVFYSGDTGPGLADCWPHILPQLIITEVTAPDRYKEWAAETGHLSPALLQRELTSFRELKGYLPPVVVVHMSPHLEPEIASEVAAVGRALAGSITLGYEGMELEL